MKKLLILPGATDPHYSHYKQRYDLVINEAYKRGYTDVELISWIGQASNKTAGLMNLEVTSNQLKGILQAYEVQNYKYDVFAFSWGANVYLKTLYEIDQPKKIGNTLLWGIDEYWRMKYYFLDNDKISKTIISFKNKDTSIDPDFFLFELPNEIFLKDYPHSNPIRIGFGANDSLPPTAFSDYLKSFVKKENISFVVVPNVEHVVTEYDQNYIDCLFKI